MGEETIQRFESLLPATERRPIEPSMGFAHAEERVDLRAYFRALRKHRWTILSTVSIIFTLVLVAVVKERPVYRAQTLLEIGQENQNTITVQELFQLENVTHDYLETQYRILESDAVARDVIRQLNLDQMEEFNPGKGADSSEAGRAGENADPLPVDPAGGQLVLERFRDRLDVNPIRQSRLVQVSFDSYDPKLAAKVVNTFSDRYIQQNLQAHWDAAQKASEWLSQQLDGLKIKLEKSEDDLQRYAQANDLLFLEGGKSGTQNIVDERLEQLQSELTQAQAERYQKESLYRLLEAGDLSSIPGIADSKLVQDLTLQLADAERAKADLAPNFTSDYPKMKQVQSQIDHVEQLLTEQREQAAGRIANEYSAAVRRETLVRSAFDEQQRQANQAAAKSVQYNILKREAETNKQLYEDLLVRLKEAGVSAGMKASNIRVVDPAVPPSRAVKPRITLSLALALSAGLTLGIVLALLQEHMDNTLKSPDDVEQFLQVPALALIPAQISLERRKNGSGRLPAPSIIEDRENGSLAKPRRGQKKDWVRIDAEIAQHSALSEAFRGLRTSVLLSTAGRPPRSLTFVSAEPGEGKTTICSNLGICLAQLGKRVLLIDADMRRPSLHRLFKLDANTGVVNYLTGDQAWKSLVQTSSQEGLHCLVCGPVPPNPSELLSSGRMQELIHEALTEYDFLLFDSPPLLSVADGRILSTIVEGTILVVKGGVTPRDLVRHAQLLASDVGAHLIGAVLNNVNFQRNDYYYSRYYSYRAYTEEAPGESHA